MLALGPGVILALTPDILLRSVPGQDIYYAFNVATGDHFRLNRTSYWILETIGDGIEWTELETRFLDSFDVPQYQGKADLETTIDQFLQERIIRRVTGGKAEDSL